MINNPLSNCRKANKKWLAISLVTVFVLIIIIVATIAVFNVRFNDRIYPGIRIGNINLGGLTKTNATDLLYTITDEIEKDGIKIIYTDGEGLNLEVTPVISALTDPDLSRSILEFKNHETIDTLYSVGRSENMWQNSLAKLKSIVSDQSYEVKIVLDTITLRESLGEQFSKLETPALNARPLIEDDQISILPEQDGQTINYENVIKDIENNLHYLKNSSLEIKTTTTTAVITLSDVEDKVSLIEQITTTTTPKLMFENKYWQISKKDLANMLEFQKAEEQITVGLNFNKWNIWLNDNITAEINIDPHDAQVELVGNRITRFVPHREGQAINSNSTYRKLNEQLLSDNLTVDLIVEVAKPDITIGSINDMGVTEIIGSGSSNFAGSPYNRRHNIKVGAEKLHGVLIKPDEEFSLMTTLGNIDANSGYRQELVIKGNKTIPEYGGGLCQIGTTTFRAAIGTGLPITERRSHAYSVSYYLQDGLPGFDATVYVPHPDVRFVNNTGNYILIQTEIKGNELTFEFWGTKDGRIVERGDIRTWDWTSPPETKYIETLDLPIGQKKCTESSHKGVKAAFDYTVTYLDGEVKEETFYSTYRPWQAVCLIGVEKLSEEEADDQAPESI